MQQRAAEAARARRARPVARPGRLRVLLYHHLTDKPCPLVDKLDISTPPEVFEAHLSRLARDYDLVSLADVLSGDLPKRPLLLTFDDGYRSVYDVAGPMLRDRGLPAVFFVSAGIVDGLPLPLGNLLCYLTNQIGLEQLERAVSEQSPRYESLGQLIDQRIAPLPYEQRMALIPKLAEKFKLDLGRLRRESGLFLSPHELPLLDDVNIELANHTQSHVHCRCLTQEQAQVEIVESKRRLEEWSGRPVRGFSYPYGSRADAVGVAQEALQRSGHEAMFLVEARANPRRHGGPNWYRVSMQAQPAGKIPLRTEWLPKLRSINDRLRGRPGLAAGAQT